MKTKTLYETIMQLLHDYNIDYKEFNHDSILCYEDAEREKNKYGWEGVESKNVFLRGTNGKYYIFVTVQGKRVNFTQLKNLLKTKLSLASEEEVKNILSCVPGCVAPFGFSDEIYTVIDPSIYEYTNYLFSPGVTTKTIQLNVQDIKPIFDKLTNHLV